MNRQKNATREKLKEANFFLKKLISSRAQLDSFRYYLSAFLSSSRSVSWIMKSEYGNNPEWKKWWQNKQLSDSEYKIFKLFTEARNKSQKSDNYQIGFEVSFTFNPSEPINRKRLESFTSNGKKIHVTIEYENDNVEVGMDDKSNVYREKNRLMITNAKYLGFEPVFPSKIFNNTHSEKIIESCERYYEILQRLVEECSSLFSPEPPENRTQ